MNADQQGGSSGFTLIELVVTLVIAVVLSTLAVPGFTNLTRQLRLTVATSELYTAINLTRAEAIRRNGKVSLIAIHEDWKNGWVIASGENQQILIHEPLHQELRVEAKFTDGKQHIAFNGTGQTRRSGSSIAPQSGHIYLHCGDHSRLITINFLGRAKVCNPAKDKSCSINEAD